MASLYRPFPYQGKGTFKYSVYVRSTRTQAGRRIIHFGHTQYQHYLDKGGHYAHLNHLDKARRKRYRARAQGITNQKGEHTYTNRDTANYWSYHYLW